MSFVPSQPNFSTSGQQFAPDPGAAARRLAQETMFGSRTATAAYGAQTRPVADPNCKLVNHQLGFQDAGRLCLGYIMDGSAIANCYRVHLEKAHAPIMAVPLSGTGNCILGATEINTYPPGTPVIVMLHDKGSLGYIIGAVPNILQTGQSAYHDYISQASRKRVDDCHKKYLKMYQSGGMVDASGWRPFDQTLAGEWGAITMTGCKITLDDFMVQVAVNEMCGIWGFYNDSLLRIAAYNLQFWTGANEHEIYVDQAETYDFQGFSPYAWEGNAAAESDGSSVREFEPSQYQCTTGCPWYAHWENSNEYSQGFHRTQLWHGYLGQGQRLLVQLPPKGKLPNLASSGDTVTPPPAYDSPIETESGGGGGAQCGSCSPPPKPSPEPPTPPAVLHEDNIGLDGRRFIASAKGIVIAKRMLLPSTVRQRRPDAPDGDDAATNYKTAGKFGDGDGQEHPITGDIKAEDEHKNLQRASGVLDLHAYLFNYAGIHPFYWHRFDFRTFEQDELEYAEYQHKVPDYTQLMSSMYLKEIEPKQIEVDHRYKSQNFYETTSAISLLEDGSVVISDGYGAEIKMSGGCLFLTAPGDVWMKSGRHCQMWSGGDGIIRANGSVEMSTTEKSIRLKSEKDVLILAGNKDNHGGVLIESRGKMQTYDFEKAGDEVQFGGVVLRAPNSNVISLAHQIYLRSGGGDSKIEPGNITIDAGKGTKDLVTKSNRIFNYVGEDGQIANFFSLAQAEDPQVAHYFSRDYTLLSGNLAVTENLIGGKGLLCRDFLLCDGPIVGDTVVFPCTGKCSEDIQKVIDEIKDYIYNKLPRMANEYHDDYLALLWYGEKRAGNDRVMDIMEFSFRTDEQYNIPDFMLYEDRWQQLARLSGKIPGTWTETGVQSTIAGETYPFPGKKWLIDESAYRTQDFNLVEQADDGLRDKKRGKCPDLAKEYKEPEYNTAAPGVINGTYPIIFQR